MSDVSINQIADRVWDYRLANDFYYRLRMGPPIERCRTGSPDEIEADAAFARTALKDLDAVDVTAASADGRNTTAMLRYLLGTWADAPQHHLVSFTVTPYAASMLTSALQHVFSKVRFDSTDD